MNPIRKFRIKNIYFLFLIFIAHLIFPSYFHPAPVSNSNQIYQSFVKRFLFSAMCGDGANDCGALKAAHVGISLSEAESSVASPFTAKEQNISCVPRVIKEGRAALITSFGVFKMMVCYSLTELASVIILYNIDANLSSPQFLFIDVCLILNFASVFGLTKAYSSLSVTPPTSSLMALVPIMSMFFFMALATGFQVLGNVWIKTYPWFTPFIFQENVQSFFCYENYAVFCVSMFQYVAMAVVFSKGKPYRKPLYTNPLYTISLLLTTFFCLYLTLIPHQWIADLLEMKMPPMEGRVAMIVISLIFFICCFVVEEIVVEFFVNRVVVRRLNCPRNLGKKFLQNEDIDWYQLNTNGATVNYLTEKDKNGVVNEAFLGSRDVLTSTC